MDATYRQTTVTTERHEWVLPIPYGGKPYGELLKMLSMAQQTYRDNVTPNSVTDDAILVDIDDDTIVLYFEVEQ